MPTDPILLLENVQFGWDSSHDLITIDRFTINKGESVFLRGPSGTGKSTLLGLIGGVMVPRAGSIAIDGEDLATQKPARRDRIRADQLGIIFQQFNLLPYLNVLDNITLPCQFSNVRKQRAQQLYGSEQEAALQLSARLGLQPELLQKPTNKLSVGQQQRAAAARALIGGPSLIIADEPTSALDSENRNRFIELLNEQREAFNTSLLFVSHDPTLAGHFDRVEEFEQLNRTAVTSAQA